MRVRNTCAVFPQRQIDDTKFIIDTLEEYRLCRIGWGSLLRITYPVGKLEGFLACYWFLQAVSRNILQLSVLVSFCGHVSRNVKPSVRKPKEYRLEADGQ